MYYLAHGRNAIVTLSLIYTFCYEEFPKLHGEQEHYWGALDPKGEAAYREKVARKIHCANRAPLRAAAMIYKQR